MFIGVVIRKKEKVNQYISIVNDRFLSDGGT